MNEDSKDIIIKRLKKRIANNEKRMIKKNLFIAELLLVDQRVDDKHERHQAFIWMKTMQGLLDIKRKEEHMKLSGDNLRLEKENKILRENIKQLTEVSENINTIVPDRVVLSAEIERLRTVLKQLVSENQEWARQVEAYKQVISNRDTEIERYQDRIAELESKIRNHNLSANASDFDQQLQWFQEQHKFAQQLVKDLESEVEDLKRELSDAKCNTSGVLNQEITRLKIKLEMANKETEKWELVASNINDQLTKSEEYIAELREVNEELSQSVFRLTHSREY